MKKLALLFLFLFLVSVNFAAGTTRFVPGSYSTIQAAINAAVPGDVIQVAAGTYSEALTVNKSDLTIQGAGPTLTILRTLGSAPAITLTANNFLLKSVKITNSRQVEVGILVSAPATQGLTLDAVYMTLIGNDANNAYGVEVTTSLSNVWVKNCQFSSTIAASRSIAIHAGSSAGGNTFAQTNWVVENSVFAYLYVGIYANSSVNGLTVQNNNFGPWDLSDCKQAASGLYIGDGGDNLSIDNVTVTGNTFTSYARGVYFLDDSPNKLIGKTTITNNTFTNSIWSSGIRLVAGTQLYGTYNSAKLEGPVTICANNFTQNTKIQNGSGVAMIDFRTCTGGESSTSLITVCNNTINFSGPFDVSTWGILLRGPLTRVDILGNTLSGGNAGGVSVNMPPTSGICVQTDYLDYGPMTSNAFYNIQNNSVTGFVNGIAVYNMLTKYYGSLPAGATIAANNNSLVGNTYAIYSGAGGRTNARNNWWGTNTGPFHSTNTSGSGNPVTDYVDFLPWWCNAAMTTMCPQAPPGGAILNTNTGIWYPSTGLGTAFAAALNGHTLYVAPGSVNGATYNYPGKTVNLIGTGKPGESTITGPGRPLTINSGSLNVSSGLMLNTAGYNVKNIYIDGGTLKLRDCILYEDPTSYQSALAVLGGTVDAGTANDKGGNLFLVNGTGAAVYNSPLATVHAIGNDWGSTKGPKINTNIGGNGGEIFGPGMSFVLYDPWKGSPVTVASKVKVCVGGTTATVPVKVAKFVNVGSLSLQISYDATKLNTPTLSYQDAAFAPWGYLQINTATPGTILITGIGAWPNPGLTLADSTVIFSLSFNVAPGLTTTALSFTDTGTSCQYTASAPFFMKFGDSPQADHYINGSITYDPNPPVPVSVTIAAAVNPVTPGSTVTLTATPVNGGYAPSFQWKVKGVNAGTNSATFTYTPNNGDEVKCVVTSNAECVSGNPATSNSLTIWVINQNVTVSDTTYNSESNCYNAGQVITVGGAPNQFLVKTGGSATLIAGQSILFYPGCIVEAGGYMHGYIAPSGPANPQPSKNRSSSAPMTPFASRCIRTRQTGTLR